MMDVLDDGTSHVAKDAPPAGPSQVQVTTRPPAPAVDTQIIVEAHGTELAGNKRPRTDLMERPSRSSSTSSRGGTVGWNFAHSKPGSILDDSWGLATLMRHMKRTGCSLPSLGNLSNRDEYIDIAHYMGQLAGAINRAQLKMENTIHNAPDAAELAQVTELVKATKVELDQAKAQIVVLQAENERLGAKADAQQGKIETMALDLQVKNRRIPELEAARRNAEHQVRELISSSQISQKNKEAEVKLATRRGKKEVAEAYNKILAAVKEKFAKKKEEVELQVYAQELQANADLLKDMLSNEIKNVDEEYNQLMAMIPDAVMAYERAQVSDFSVSKLSLPQLSESSGTIEINMFNPSFSGEYGSNLSSMDHVLVPVEASAQEGDDGTGGGDPNKNDDPSTKDQDVEEGPTEKDA